MTRKFIIMDELHAEWQGQYDCFEDAIEELKKRMQIPWDHEPNICPCTSWRTCGRNYEIIECETNEESWSQIKRTPILEISSKELKWLLE